MIFLPWQLSVAYVADLILGDPGLLPHPVRWIGRLIAWVEAILYDGSVSSGMQKVAGCLFWALVMLGVTSGTMAMLGLFAHLHWILGDVVMIWLASTTLATRSLHQESRKVARALRDGNIQASRKMLARLVSRETDSLDVKGIVRALLETVSENMSDGIVAPLFFLALGGPVLAVAYKAVNTMDSMVGYQNERYRHFGWFAARADDWANWIPARITALIIALAAACLRLNWRESIRVARRDANKMKSPNAGYPEAAAAGALGVQLGGASVYFGKVVEKPTLGDSGSSLVLQHFGVMIRLMYVTSFLSFLLALFVRFLLVRW
jgi:adenosylcobinamide-phosphate synthase